MIQSDVPSDRIAVREIIVRHGLIDDRYPRVPLVLKVEIAPHEERDTESLEALGRNQAYRDIVAILRTFLETFYSCETTSTCPRKWSRRAQRGRVHARNAFQAIQKYFVCAG